jgi:hypothetical protein
VSFIDTLRGLSEIESEWRDLITEGAHDELLHDPSIVRLWLSDPSYTLTPAFVAVRSGGRLVGIAPFYYQQTELPVRLSVVTLATLRVRALRLFGDRILLRRDANASEVLRDIFATLHDLRHTFDVIWVYAQRLDDPLWRFLSTGGGARASKASAFRLFVTSPHVEKWHHLTFDRPFDDYTALIRTRPGFPGKTIRRFWRDMKDRCTIERITSPSQVRGFADDVDRVYNASWQARTYGQRRRNAESDVTRLEAIAALGYLRSYVLRLDGEPVAFVLGYQYRGRYAYEETGYDPKFSTSSPGSVLTHGLIQDLFADNPPRELDFGFGDGAYKRTFGTGSVDVCSMYLTRRFRWRAVLAGQRMVNRCYEAAHRSVTRLGIDATVRRLLKRQR